MQQKEGVPANRVVAEAEMAKKVAFLLFPGFEMLDFYGPVSIFGSRKLDGAYQILTVSQIAGPVPSSVGVSTVTEYDFDTCPRPDILIVVGELASHTSSLQILCITGCPCMTQHSQPRPMNASCRPITLILSPSMTRLADVIYLTNWSGPLTSVLITAGLCLWTGGFGTRKEIDNPRLISFIQRYSPARGSSHEEATFPYLLTVCTGAALAARAGVLDGR